MNMVAMLKGYSLFYQPKNILPYLGKTDPLSTSLAQSMVTAISKFLSFFFFDSKHVEIL